MSEPNELPEFDFGAEQANRLAEHVLRVKMTSVAERAGEDDNADLLPVCMPIRGEEFLGYYIGKRVDRDLGLTAAYFAAVGFGATEFLLGLDARMQIFDKDDLQHEIERGELQRLAEEGTPEQNAQIAECLIIIRSQRERTQFYSFPYEVVHDEAGYHLRWLTEKKGIDADSDRDGQEVQGYVQDSLHRAWESAKGMEETFSIAHDQFGLGYEEARIHADMAVLNILSARDITALYNADTELKQKIIEGSTKSGALQGMSVLTGDQFDAFIAGKLDQS